MAGSAHALGMPCLHMFSLPSTAAPPGPAELIAGMRSTAGGPPDAPPSDESELCSNWLTATQVGLPRQGLNRNGWGGTGYVEGAPWPRPQRTSRSNCTRMAQTCLPYASPLPQAAIASLFDAAAITGETCSSTLGNAEFVQQQDTYKGAWVWAGAWVP